jgi:hypothetical protein
MTQIYMILSAVGYERGPPIAVFFDPFAAKRMFDAIDNMVSAFIPKHTAFLVAYELQKDGQLLELEELGRK